MAHQTADYDDCPGSRFPIQPPELVRIVVELILLSIVVLAIVGTMAVLRSSGPGGSPVIAFPASQ